MNNKELKTIIKMFETSSLSKLKLVKDNVTVELEKPQEIYKEVVPQESVPVVKPVEVKKETPKNLNTLVKAPLVGTYYEAPAPDQPPFVRVGKKVKKGDTLCIIEAMKVMNEITAPIDGEIKAIHIKNSDMVMYDQIIMEIL